MIYSLWSSEVRLYGLNTFQAMLISSICCFPSFAYPYLSLPVSIFIIVSVSHSHLVYQSLALTSCCFSVFLFSIQYTYSLLLTFPIYIYMVYIKNAKSAAQRNTCTYKCIGHIYTVIQF